MSRSTTANAAMKEYIKTLSGTVKIHMHAIGDLVQMYKRHFQEVCKVRLANKGKPKAEHMPKPTQDFDKTLVAKAAASLIKTLNSIPAVFVSILKDVKKSRKSSSKKGYSPSLKLVSDQYYNCLEAFAQEMGVSSLSNMMESALGGSSGNIVDTSLTRHIFNKYMKDYCAYDMPVGDSDRPNRSLAFANDTLQQYFGEGTDCVLRVNNEDVTLDRGQGSVSQADQEKLDSYSGISRNMSCLDLLVQKSQASQHTNRAHSVTRIGDVVVFPKVTTERSIVAIFTVPDAFATADELNMLATDKASIAPTLSQLADKFRTSSQ